jgi:NADH:ubiquinone oxidoreductase subunit F (NADH-binding)
MSTTVSGDLGSATVIVMDKSTDIVMVITRFP